MYLHKCMYRMYTYMFYVVVYYCRTYVNIKGHACQQRWRDGSLRRQEQTHRGQLARAPPRTLCMSTAREG